MSTLRRLAPLVALVLLFIALPSLAVDEPTGDTTTETTITPETETDAEVAPPAVTVPPTAADEETPDWTYRYLVPTLIALAVLVVVITTVQYFVRVVRSRYKVVE